MSFQNDMEPVDPFARPAVHLVRHRGGAHLTGCEAFARGLVPRHQAQGLGQAGRSGSQFHEGRYDAEIQAPGIDLTDAAQDRRKAEVMQETFFEPGNLVRVPLHQGQLIELRADRPFQAPSGVGCGDMPQLLDRSKELLTKHGESFSEGRQLRGNVVGAGGEHQIGGLASPQSEPEESGSRLVFREPQGF